MGTNTTNYEFYKPAEDETSWADNVNDTFDDLDSMLNANFVVTQASGSLDNEHIVAKPITGPATSTDNAVVRWDGTSGSVVQDSGVIIDDSDNISGITTLTATNIAAHNLTGKLTSGSVEIEGSNFDIDGGDISAGTVSGGLTWSAAQDLNDQALTNINVDSGSIDNTDIGAITPATGAFTSLLSSGYRQAGLVTKTSGYTAANEQFILVDATSGSVVITLPSGISGRVYTVKHTSGSHGVSVIGTGGDTIDGETTQDLILFDALKVVSDSTNWFII